MAGGGVSLGLNAISTLTQHLTCKQNVLNQNW